MDYVFWFNVFETILWSSLATFCLSKAPKIVQRRRQLLLMAFLFAVFAISEVVETQTGAWWKPWWLAAWKGLCIAGLLTAGIGHFQWQKRQASETDAHSSE